MQKSPSSSRFIICALVISMEITNEPGWMWVGADISYKPRVGPHSWQGHGHFPSPFDLAFLTANLQLQTQRVHPKISVRHVRDWEAEELISQTLGRRVKGDHHSKEVRNRWKREPWKVAFLWTKLFILWRPCRHIEQQQMNLVGTGESRTPWHRPWPISRVLSLSMLYVCLHLSSFSGRSVIFLTLSAYVFTSWVVPPLRHLQFCLCWHHKQHPGFSSNITISKMSCQDHQVHRQGPCQHHRVLQATDWKCIHP